MPAKRKYKRPPIDPEEIKYILTKDGRILAFDETNSLVCINNENTLPSSAAVTDAIDFGNLLNTKGGINYETTEKVLDNYRFYAFTERTLSKMKEPYKAQLYSGKIDLAKTPLKLKLTNDDDIRDVVSLMADIKELPDQLKKFANNTNNIVLSANIIRIIDDVIDYFKSSGSERYVDAANMIYDRYIDPALADATAEDFMKKAKKKKHQYYDDLSAAISLMSATLFGVFPSDNNLLHISLNDSGIEIKVI